MTSESRSGVSDAMSNWIVTVLVFGILPAIIGIAVRAYVQDGSPVGGWLVPEILLIGFSCALNMLPDYLIVGRADSTSNSLGLFILCAVVLEVMSTAAVFAVQLGNSLGAPPQGKQATVIYCLVVPFALMGGALLRYYSCPLRSKTHGSGH